MLEKKSHYLILSLIAGCLFLHNAIASESGDGLLNIIDLVKHQQKVAQSAGYVIQDAKSALLQARHVLLEDKHRSRVPDPELLQIQILTDEAAINLERAREIAGRIENMKVHV